jgi:hypothetical protein
VRRASAISLLMTICFSLIVPAVVAESQPNLPTCCRKTGVHHCSMGSMGSAAKDEAPVGESSVRAIRRSCSAFPSATAVPATAHVAFVKDSSAIFAAPVSRLSIQFQTEVLFRISFSRARQKRGPPTILS